MHHNTPRETEPAAGAEAKPERASTTYCAAAFGALCLGLGDLINNGTAATALKFGEVMRQTILPSFESVGLLSFLVLAVLGGGTCWVHQPQTRVDAFTRGFSVFALLAVATPYDPPGRFESRVDDPPPFTEDAGSAVGELSPARYDAETVNGYRFASAGHRAGYRLAVGESPSERFARELVEKWRQKGKGYGLAGIRLEAPGGSSGRLNGLVIRARERKTARIVGEERWTGNGVMLLRSKGPYTIEIEGPGFRRVSFDIQLDDRPMGYSVRLEESSVPLNLQRLVAAGEVVPKKTVFSLPAQ